MSPVEIAPARTGDVTAILALAAGTPGAPRWTGTVYHAIILAAEGSGTEGSIERCFFVVKRDGSLAGFAIGKTVSCEAEIESVVVAAEHRRRGVGRALCTAIAAWAWDRQATQIDLEVRASSHGAIALYAGLGFAPVGRRRAYYAAPTEDALLMRLDRRPPSSGQA